MVNASHPNILYASSNVLIVLLILLLLMFFGFLTYQPIALSSTPNTQIFLFLPSTLLPLLPLVEKISIVFFSNNPLFFLFLFKIFKTISTTRFSLLELIAHHLTLLQRLLLPLSHFSPITFTDLISIIKAVSSSSCFLDLILPKILHDLFSFFYPIILNFINLFLATSKFPTSFKSSVVTPILTKPSLDPSIISNYRPISNHSFFSKILETAIYLQISNFLLSNKFLTPSQSGFQPSHSTETCLLKICDDAFLASDSGKLSFLLSLEFFSVLDTVDHSLLLQHLNSSFGISAPHFLGLPPIFLTVPPLFFLTTLLLLFSLFLLVFLRNLFSGLFFLFYIPLIFLVSSNLFLFKVSFLLTTPISSLLFLFLPFLLLLKGLVFVFFLFFHGVTPCILNLISVNLTSSIFLGLNLFLPFSLSLRSLTLLSIPLPLFAVLAFSLIFTFL